MKKTIFEIPKMDCLTEERIIRMRLEDFQGINNVSFDIHQRQLSILHEGSPDLILNALISLKFEAKIKSSENFEHGSETNTSVDKDDDSK